MELSDRKKKVLFSIVTEYIQTAEPVGSKVICEKYMDTVSSATIRNEMADLTELGLIEQPHTSAGRIPSSLGYRYFVNEMSRQRELSALDERKVTRTLSKRVTQLEKLMKAVCKQINQMTGLTTITTMPRYKNNQVKRFELIGIDDYTFVLVVATKNGIVKSKVFRTGEIIDENILMKISSVLNRRFENLSVDKMTLPVILSVQKDLIEYDFILPPILQFIYETVDMMDENEVIIEGITNIFDYPEYKETSQVKEIFELLADKDKLRKMLAVDEEEAQTIRITIGEENHNPVLSTSTMVMGYYKINGKSVGTICVLGPTRLDYSKVVPRIEFFVNSLNQLLEESYYEPDEALKQLLSYNDYLE